MKQQIVQINFRYNASRRDFEKAVSIVANYFAEFPGLLWKIWLMNEAKQEAGGIYLFDDPEAVARFKSSELFLQAANNPAYSNFSVRQFGVLENPSILSHAPLRMDIVGVW